MIQKATMSKLLNLSKKYAKAMVKIMKSGSLPINYENKDQKDRLVIVDFSVHLVQFLLLELIPSSQNLHDIAFSLSYKVAKQFEMLFTQIQVNGLDLVEFLVAPLASFVQTVLGQMPLEVPLYEQEHQGYAQYVYSNLILINMFLQRPADSIKDSKLKFHDALVKRIQEKVIQDEKGCEVIIQWVQKLFKIFDEGFKQGNCSFRSKYEDGVKTDTYEVHGSSSQGVGINLLKPQF